MSEAEEYLENLQGLITFMYLKRNKVVSLYDINRLDQITLANLQEEFKEFKEEIFAWHRERDLATIDALEKGNIRHLKEAEKHLSKKEIEKQLIESSNYIKDLKTVQHSSRFQETLHYEIIKPLYERIANAAEELGAKRPSNKIILASFRTQQVNAVAIKLKSSEEFIIGFESQLFSFLNRFTKLISQSLPLNSFSNDKYNFSTKKEDVIAYVKDNSPIQTLFTGLILSYAVTGNVDTANDLILDYPQYINATYLLTAMELFIMGHEYGHIVKGHLNKKPGQTLQLSNIDAEQMQRNWDQEYEADTLGLYFSIKASIKQGFQEDYDLIGADLYFMLREIVAKSVSIIKYGDENATKDSESHPAVKDRRDNLRKSYLKSFSSEQLVKAEYLPTALEDVLNYLWNETKPVLHHHYTIHKGKFKI